MLDGLMLSASLRDSLEKATATFEKNVGNLQSFLEPRGISLAAAEAFRLGYVSDEIPGYERFVGMMSLPYLTRAGVVKLKFRRLVGDGPKYDGPSSPSRLYNVRAIETPGDRIAICEGELDALVCTTVVGVPAVGTPGTSFLDHWPRCFADYDEVLIVADNDEKDDGSNPGVKHAKSVSKKLPNSRIVMPPNGLDLNDWVLQHGVEAVQKAMGM